MTTFTIDTDNNITAHAAAPAAQDNLAAFASQKELSKATAEWPISRLVETWNSFAGTPGFDDLKPVKKFENRAKATARIWAAIQKLEAAPAPQAATPAPPVAPSPRRRPRLPRPQQARPRRGCLARSARRRSCTTCCSAPAAPHCKKLRSEEHKSELQS